MNFKKPSRLAKISANKLAKISANKLANERQFVSKSHDKNAFNKCLQPQIPQKNNKSTRLQRD
jgi:hypothetical protein